jgi:hypothetical protein
MLVKQMRRKQQSVHLKKVKEVAIQKQRKYGVNMKIDGAMIATTKMNKHQNRVKN